MNIALVKDRRHDPYWYVICRTVEQVEEWFDKQTVHAEGVRDFACRVAQGKHASTHFSRILEVFKGWDDNGFHVPAEAFEKVLSFGMGARLDAVAAGNVALMNDVGGWRTLSADDEILIEQTIDDFHQWPDAEPKFIRWPKGTHWYAKFGPVDVVVDGKQKWDSRQEAETAVAHWMKTKTPQKETQK